MKYDFKNNKYFRWGLTAFLTIAASICFYYLLFHGNSIKTGFHTITGILMPVLYGLVTAYLLTPVLNYIETKLLFPLCRKLKVKENKKRNSIVRGIGILITAFLFIALIYSLVAMMLSQIVPSIVNIASNFDTYISNFTKWISKIMDDNPELGSQITFLIDKYSVELENWLNDTVLTKTSQVIMTVSLSVINILKGLWDFIIGFVISIYVLASKEKFAGQAKKMAYAFFEQKSANRLIKSFRFTHNTFIGFIGGKIVDSFIIGCLCFIGTTLLQTPYAALVSVIVGVTNIIPFFGPYLGAIPSAILTLVSVSATPISTRKPLPMLPVTSPSTFTSACCTRCITNRICLLLSYVFLFLIFFILLEISLIFDLMIPLQPGIQLMESFLINILQIRVLYSLYRQILFSKEGIDYCLNRRINYRKNGHTDDHTKDSK